MFTSKFGSKLSRFGRIKFGRSPSQEIVGQFQHLDPSQIFSGPARFLWADSSISFPSSLAEIINMSLYDSINGWNDFGATKNGISISSDIKDSGFSIDFDSGVIEQNCEVRNVFIESDLSETTLDRLQIAWEGNPVTIDASPGSGSEKNSEFGYSRSLKGRRLAILAKAPNNKIMGFIFRKTERIQSPGPIAYTKLGPQTLIPIKFSCVADTSISDPTSNIFVFRQQA